MHKESVYDTQLIPHMEEICHCFISAVSMSGPTFERVLHGLLHWFIFGCCVVYVFSMGSVKSPHQTKYQSLAPCWRSINVSAGPAICDLWVLWSVLGQSGTSKTYHMPKCLLSTLYQRLYIPARSSIGSEKPKLWDSSRLLAAAIMLHQVHIHLHRH